MSDNKYLQNQEEVRRSWRLLEHRACFGLGYVLCGFYSLDLMEDGKIQGNSEETCIFIFYSSNFLLCISDFLVEKVQLYYALCCHVEAPSC